MPQQLLLDATSEGTGTELDVMGGAYSVTAMDLPSFSADSVYAGSSDSEGDLLANTRAANARGSITVQVRAASLAAVETAVDVLRAKVAKVYAEGGTLRRVTASGAYRTCDLQAVESWVPDVRVEYPANYARVTFQVVARPFWRGAPVTLSAHSETTLPVLIFTETGILGDVPALGTLVLTEADAESQLCVLWGVQSRYYDADADAALFYQAESRTLYSGTASGAVAGASGGNAARTTNIGTSWGNRVGLGPSAGSFCKHAGGFRVIARVLNPTANTGTVRLRFAWLPGEASGGYANNAPVTVAENADWQLVDLGTVSIPPVRHGSQWWDGTLQAISTVAADDFDTDWIALIPTSEGSGQVSGASVLPASQEARISYDRYSAQSETNDNLWYRFTVTGDYLTIPPAGQDGRTLRMIVKASRGTAPNEGSADAGIDDLTGTLTYVPRYLSAP